MAKALLFAKAFSNRAATQMNWSHSPLYMVLTCEPCGLWAYPMASVDMETWLNTTESLDIGAYSTLVAPVSGATRYNPTSKRTEFMLTESTLSMVNLRPSFYAYLAWLTAVPYAGGNVLKLFLASSAQIASNTITMKPIAYFELWPEVPFIDTIQVPGGGSYPLELGGRALFEL